MLAVFMAVVLAVSMTPSGALASDDAVAADSSLDKSQAQTQEQTTSDSATQDETAQIEGLPEASASTTGTDAASDEAEGQQNNKSVDAANLASKAAAVTAAATTQQPQDSDNAPAMQTLSSSAKVYIQDSKDKNSTWSTKSGMLNVGDVIWANMYDGYSSATNPGTWAYTWYAGTKSSGDVSDYTEVVGHEQSLAITDEMAGKCFICKVTADGKDYYGPAKSYGDGVDSNYIPGPVLAAGQAKLYKVELDKKSPSVGDTLTATAYTDYSTKVTDDINVTYTWSYSDSSYGDYAVIAGATGNTLVLTEAYKDKFIKVEATAGINTESAKTSDAVLAQGAVKLSGVKIVAPSKEVGATLTAKAYTGSSYSPTYVDESKVNVTYTWEFYKGDSAPGYSTKWTKIEDATGSTFRVTEEYAGCYINVTANAGVKGNDVTLGYSDDYGVGPFKLAGAVDISAVSVVNTKDDNSVFVVGDTAKARAREKGAASNVFVEASKLDYQWLVSDKKNGTYTELEGATSETLELTPTLEGKYLKCRVKSKIGSSENENRTGYLIAKAGSVNVTSVALSATGKINVGDTLTATAKAASDDVTNDEHVTWSWYYGDSSTSCDTKIEGAAGNTLEVTNAYLGKYIQARADGGFGATKNTAGPVTEAGAVSLHHVELSGSAKVDATLTAKVYVSSYTEVSASDKVHYQWQYADTKTSSDSAFKDIEGAADAPTFTVTEALLGKYIRVKATSDGSVVSTEKPGYYDSGTTKVDPLGPVTLAGQYTLSSVDIADAYSTILQVGRTITPQAKIEDSYYTKPAPSDAKLTYTWYAKGADDADWTKVTDGVAADGALTIGEGLAGKSLKVEASALANTKSWTSGTTVAKAGEYNLLRVITTPLATSSTTNLIAGDTVAAEAQSHRADDNTVNGIKVADGVTFAWYVSDAKDGEFTKLDGIDGASITVPDAAAGKYLKVVATSGSSSVETAFANKVIDRNSIDAVVTRLKDKSVKPSPTYGEDTNINKVLEAKIADLGFEGVTAKVKSVDFSSTDAKATVGISADDKTNGDITYFYMDPNDYSGYNFDDLRSASVTFELTKDGKTAEYKPGNVTVPWNEDMLQQRLDNVASQIAIQYADGDTADSVTGNLTLPYKAGANNKFDVTWESSSDQIKIDGYSWENKTGKVTRSGTDRTVTLTATVKLMNNYGGSDVEVVGTHAFEVAVKADPQKVEAEKKELQEKVDAGFTYDDVTYFDSGSVADKGGLTDDLQMPTAKTLGVDGKYYKVKYSASTDDVTFNGYKGTVYRPEPGKDAAATKITLTVTDKSNPGITASKTLDYKIKPFEQTDLDNELKLMEAAKAGYAQAILNGQDANAVTGNLHAFQKAYLDADGKLVWTYDRSITDVAPEGIVPVELPGYDDMGTQGWRLFKSSDNAVVQHENLVVSQPEYNTEITITSRLSSEKYARYAERYPDNTTYAQLANQEVTATITVIGAQGAKDPDADKTITVKVGITGLTGKTGDKHREKETLVPLQSITVKASEKKTAADVLNVLLDTVKKDGTTLVSNNYGLTSITLKDGRVLDSFLNEEPYRYWEFYVNDSYGQGDQGTAKTCMLQDGMTVEYRYFDGAVGMCAVSFESNGGSAVSSQSVKEGTSVAKPSDPTRTGYSFAGWYKDEACTQEYDFETPVTDDITLYAKWAKKAAATVSVIGVKDPDAVTPVQDTWLGDVSLSYADDGETTAWDLIKKALDDAGLSYEASTESWGILVKSIASTSGLKLDTPSDYSRSWGFYVNGASASEGVGSYKVKAGDSLSLVYLYNFKEPATEVDGVIVDPSAKGPDWESSWPAAGTGTTSAATPTGSVEEKWTSRLKDSNDWNTYASEPVSAGDFLFIAVGDTLHRKVAKTGEDDKAAKLVSPVTSISRMVYTDGLILIPLGDGRVQALTADTLTTVWVSEKLPDGKGGAQMCQSNLTVDGGKVYFQTTAGWSGPGGYSVCLDLATGKTIWKKQAEGTKADYYWSGMGVSGAYGFVGDMDGSVSTVDLATGETKSVFDAGAPVRSGVTVAPGGKVVYIVSYDGYLHKLGVGTAGVLTELGKVKVSNSGSGFGPTSTPVLVGGKIFVGGVSIERSGKYGPYYGQLCVIDAESMTVEQSICKTTSGAITGNVQSTPVVSQQGGATYVYFTGNGNPGALYRYKVGDATAEEIYTPASANQNYCMYTPAVGADGTLYYINDSGNLFAVGSKATPVIKSFNVAFESNDGSAVDDQTVDEGGKATKPSDPTCEGYSFVGWFTDKDCTKAYDFDSAVVSDITLYAKWTKKEDAKKISVIGSVTGVDADNRAQVWADKVELELPEGATAADLSEALFKKAGLAFDADPDTQYGWALNSITSPDGRVLGTQQVGKGWAYWSLLVNGEYSQLGASSVVLKAGDSVSWVYIVPDAPVSHTVTFDSNGGSSVDAVTVEEGKTASKPADPTREGYTFAGWFSDEQLTSPFDFATLINGDTTLYAKWIENVPEKVMVSGAVYGIDTDEHEQTWLPENNFAVDKGTSVMDATNQLLTANNIEFEFVDYTFCDNPHYDLWSITLSDGRKLFNNAAGDGWQAYVNGVAVDSIEAKLSAGDKLEWRYLIDGKEPAKVVDGVVVDKNANVPSDWKADWIGYGDSGNGSATTNASTPTGDVSEAWAFDYKTLLGVKSPNASEPVLVGGYVYIAVEDTLFKVDTNTGKVSSQTKLGGKVGYTTRPVYAQGMLFVPLNGGRVQAVTVDSLTTVWMTDELSGYAQLSNTLTVDGDNLYVGTVDVVSDVSDGHYSTTYSNGYLCCIDMKTGEIKWQVNHPSEGYYWDGATVKGDFLVVSTSAGTVRVLNKQTGDGLSSVSLGTIVNSDCVLSDDGSRVYLFDRSGKLHVFSMSADGILSGVETIDVGLTGCASRPVISNGKMIVGGVSGSNAALAIIDLGGYKTQLVTMANGKAMPAGLAGIKAVPLVAVQSDGVYVYFTVNDATTNDYVSYTSGGGVYRYKLGDAEATYIYDANGHYNYCDSPVICDAQGNLYYINDSGALIKLVNKTSDSGNSYNNDSSSDGNNGNNGNNVGNGDNGNGGTPAGRGQAPGSGAAPAANALPSNSGDSANVSAASGSANETAASSSEKVMSRSATKVGSSSNADKAAAGQDDESASIWPYIALVCGIAGLVAATAWLVAAKRRKRDEEGK